MSVINIYSSPSKSFLASSILSEKSGQLLMIGAMHVASTLP